MNGTRILIATLAASFLAPLQAAVALPCKVPDNGWRVALPWLLYLNCGSFIDQLDTTGRLFAGRHGQRTQVAGVEVAVRAFGKRAVWLELRLSKNGSPNSLESGKDYEIDLAPDGQATVIKDGKPVPGPFETMTVEFSTKPVGRVEAPLFRKRGMQVQVRSNLALRSFDPNEPVFAEIGLLKDRTVLPSHSEPRGTVLTECMVKGTCAEPQPKQGSPETYGIAIVDLTEDVLRDASARVAITGLLDLFGQPLKVEGKIALGGVPKTKDEANYYLKFSHQAGPGSKPGWVADIKFAPGGGLTRIGGFYLKPQITVDAGQGTVDTARTNNLITGGLGLTRIFRLQDNGLEAVRITLGVKFETNRELNKQNLLYDQEFQIHLPDLYGPRKIRSRRMFLADPGKYSGYSDSIAGYGYGVQMFAGGEMGNSLVDRTVKASKGSVTVNVPNYSVARFRSRAHVFLEWRRITLDASVVGRFLGAGEKVTRETADGRSVRVAEVSGWRPYGEASLSIGLDKDGHIALSTTYKLGSQPPNFIKADTVQTGFLLRY